MRAAGTTRPGRRTARHGLRTLGRVVAVLVLLPVAAVSFGATATAAGTGLVQAVTLSGALSQNVTVAGTPLTVTVRYAPRPATAQFPLIPIAEGVFTPAPGTPTEGLADGDRGYQANRSLSMDLISGTVATGSTWRGTFTPLAGAKGTYRLAVGDGETLLDPAQVAAAFATPSVTTTVTAVPVKPTGLKVQKKTEFSGSSLGFYTYRTITWAKPAAGSPMATGFRVVSASSACGTLARWDLNGADATPYIYTWARASLLGCKIVFQLVNGAGPTASVTVNA